MGQLHEVQAFVVRTYPLKESDLIVSLLTEDFGIIKGVAKGARKSQKRFSGVLQPLSLVNIQFSLKEGSDLGIIQEGELLDAYQSLKENLFAFSSSSLFLEVVAEMAREHQQIPRLFPAIKTFLEIMDGRSKPKTPKDVFEGLLVMGLLKLLYIFGFMPDFKSCHGCGDLLSDFKEGIHSFSMEQGGCYCPRCKKDKKISGIEVNVQTVTTLHKNLTIKLAELSEDWLPRELIHEALHLLISFIEFHIAKPLKSKKFLFELLSSSA